MATDLYSVLGVARGAGEDEIKRAYRKLARQFHPDANPDDPAAEAKFKEVAQAYSVLSDPDRRREYDTFGTARGSSAGFDPFDIFASFFGGGFGGAEGFGFGRGRRSGPEQGSDLLYDLEVTLDEVMSGAQRTLNLRILDNCTTCTGTGARTGSSVSQCEHCGGSGAVRSLQRSVFGNVMTSFTCPTCDGSGQQITDPCPGCGGEGRVESESETTIDVPAGVDDGMQIRLRGRGEAGRRGGGKGDLYVRFRVAPFPGLERRAEHLIARIEIPVTQAALGASRIVASVQGPEEFQIPAGTQPGKVLRLRGRGLPRVGGGGRGDLLVAIDVAVPTDLTAEQEDLLRRLAEVRGEAVEEHGGLMKKIKEAFKP